MSPATGRFQGEEPRPAGETRGLGCGLTTGRLERRVADMRSVYFRKAVVRSYLAAKGKRMGGSLTAALDAVIMQVLDKAAHASGPYKTVKAIDIAAWSAVPKPCRRRR